MERDPFKPTADGRFSTGGFVMQSSKELQEWDRLLPPTDELPSTHEHFVENVIEERAGQRITVKYVGVRPKAGAAKSEPDELNKLDDQQLEVEAAAAGVKNYDKAAPKAKRVAAIRAARKELVKA